MDKSILRGHLRSDSSRATTYGGIAIDQKLVIHLIKELNNTRRQVTTYPKGHPAVQEGIQRLMKMLDDLFAIHDIITLSISDKSAQAGVVHLDRKNPVFKDIAKMLFDHGILNLKLRKGIGPDEMLAFSEVMAMRRDRVTSEGGLDALVARRNLRHVTLQKIDQKAFKIRDYSGGEAAKGLTGGSEDESWIRFARALVSAQLIPEGNLRTPEAVARASTMNLQNIAALLEELHPPLLSELKSYDWDTLVKSKKSMEKVEEFVNQIDPRFCVQLLRYTGASLGNRPATAEEILSKFPVPAIIAALTERAADGLTTPPAIMEILTTLVPQAQKETPEEDAQDDSRYKEFEMFERFRAVLEEEDRDKYMPDDYSLVLQTALKSDNLRATGLIGGAELKSSLMQHNLERHLSFVIVNLITGNTEPASEDALRTRLAGLCDYFLGVGDFSTICQIYDRLAASGKDSSSHRRTTDAVFGTPEFVLKVLDGLETWDKKKLPEVGRLIVQVGEPFAEPLLARVADEERLYLRRFCLDQLIALGPVVRDGAARNLDDARWYVVRNMVLILTKINDPSALDHLRPLAAHPHHRVRQEVFRALLHYDDPYASVVLLTEMAHDDRDVRLDAIKIAGKSRAPEIRRHLLKIAKDGGLGDTELEFRIAAVHALSDMGDPSILPLLKEILESWTLFHGAELARLKAEILKSLILYPAAEVVPLLRDTADKGKGTVAALAAVMLRNPRYGQS